MYTAQRASGDGILTDNTAHPILNNLTVYSDLIYSSAFCGGPYIRTIAAHLLGLIL